MPSQALLPHLLCVERPEGTLQILWRDDGETLVLDTEEMWKECLRGHPEGPIELTVQPKPGQPGFAANNGRNLAKRPRKKASTPQQKKAVQHAKIATDRHASPEKGSSRPSSDKKA